MPARSGGHGRKALESTVGGQEGSWQVVGIFGAGRKGGADGAVQGNIFQEGLAEGAVSGDEFNFTRHFLIGLAQKFGCFGGAVVGLQGLAVAIEDFFAGTLHHHDKAKLLVQVEGGLR